MPTPMEIWNSWKIKQLESGGGGGGALVAHATATSIPQPGDDPVELTLDKSISELYQAENSMVIVTVTNEGTTVDVFFRLGFSMQNASQTQLGYSGSDAITQVFGGIYFVSAQSVGGVDSVVLVASPT